VIAVATSIIAARVPRACWRTPQVYAPNLTASDLVHVRNGAPDARESRTFVESKRAVMFEGVGVGETDDVPAIDRAQDLVYEAWERPAIRPR
jgi:hypothetical protein